jgi:UDP-N-acetylmuramoyl-L-alanyl-D-glutamate--2,6-diaminopimelate ligase
VLVVFGCGGERDHAKRSVMGRVAARHADRVWLTSDNPRGEDPMSILEQIAEGVREEAGEDARYRALVERGDAIRGALADALPGDVVVIAGKGHESVQVVGEQSRQFDDRLVVRGALAELGFEGDQSAQA